MKKKLLCWILLLIIVLSFIATASDNFENPINYANRWVIITATENVSGKCSNRNELNTNYFTGLKKGLFICVAGAYDDKNSANSALKGYPNGSAYIRYTGSYYELSKMDSTLLGKDLLFTINLCDSVFLQCFQHPRRPDPVQSEQGNTTNYNIEFRTFKNNKKLNIDTAINVISCSNFKKVQLDLNTIALSFEENAIDESSFHVIC